MGKFTINTSNSTFYVEKLPSVETGGSLTYEYEIFSLRGDNIDISITGTIANAKISQNEIVSNYSNGIYVFSNSMKIRFNIPNAVEIGEFNSAIIRIENTTLTGTVYRIYNDEIINENDGGVVVGLKTVTGDGVDNSDPNNPSISFPDADEVSDLSTVNKFTNQSDIDKLALIENESTKNDTDSNLRNRATHTGEQPISSVTNLQSELDNKADSSQLNNVAYNDINNNFNSDQTVNGNVKVVGGLDFLFNNTGDGITGTSSANNQIMSITRQNTPSNASLGISAFGGIGLATGITSGSPESSNFDLFVDTSGKTIVKNLRINSALNPSVGQVWKAINTSGDGAWQDDEGMIGSNNLSEITNASISRSNLDIPTGEFSIENKLIKNSIKSSDNGIDMLFFDKNELTNASLRPESSVTVTTTGSALVSTANLNNMFDGSSNFSTISVNDISDLTSINIEIDLGENQSNYSSANWQPGISSRFEYGGSVISNPNSVQVEFSLNGVDWFSPSDGTSWSSNDLGSDKTLDSTLWMGSKNSATITVYRYVRFILGDFIFNTGYSSRNNIWIKQLMFRHLSAPSARQYLLASGDRMLGDLEVVTNIKTKSLTLNTPTTPVVGQIWKATDVNGNGAWSNLDSKDTVTVSSNYTILPSNRNVLVDTTSGDVEITLPEISSLDDLGVSIKKIDPSNNDVIIKTPNTEQIDLQSERLIETFLQSRTIISDGSNYWQI